MFSSVAEIATLSVHSVCLLRLLKFSDTKSAANLAYTAHVNDVYQFPDGANPNGKNWQVVDVGEDQNTGFRAIALKPEDPNDKRTIVAFAGTDDISDWGSNLGQAKGEVPPQYLEALAFGNKWKNTDGDNVILTGHSLGGGLAGFVAGQTGLRATALNSAPLALDNLGGNPLRSEVRNNPRTTQYYVLGEVLTNVDNANPLDTRPGNRIPIEGKYPAPTDPLERIQPTGLFTSLSVITRRPHRRNDEGFIRVLCFLSHYSASSKALFH